MPNIVSSLQMVTASDGVQYMCIPLDSLRLGKETSFDLYLPPRESRPPVLYRNGDLPFTEAAKSRLAIWHVDALYVKAEDEGCYRRYIESNLGELLQDQSVPMEVRSTVLYDSAKGLVKDVLSDPRSGDLLDRSGKLVDNMVNFIFDEKQSFHTLMRVTSFDYYTYTHSVNVFVFSTSLAQFAGLSPAEVRVLGNGALLHDVGKSELDADIINCPGKLSPEQWDMMRQHPTLGYDLLKEQGEDRAIVLDMVRHHHEKMSGKGYPDGLSDKDISVHVRINTIADIFDALTTRRSYKNAMQSFSSLQLMQQEMSADLDKELFRLFVYLMAK